MNKVTASQFSAMLLLSDAFALFGFTGRMSLFTVGAFSFGIIVQFLLAVLLIRYRETDCTAVKWFYMIYFIFWGGVLFNMQWQTSEAIYIPYESSNGIWGKLLISGLIALACLYISSEGIKAVSRASLIAAAVGAVYLLIVAVSVARNADIENLTRADSKMSFKNEFIRSIAMSGSLGGLSVLTGITKGNPYKAVEKYFIAKAVMTLIIMLTVILAVGGIMQITDFPTVTAAQVSQPFSAQRIDSLFLIVFVICGVFSIGVQVSASAYLLRELYPACKHYSSSITLAVMLLSAFLISKTDIYGGFTASAVILAMLIVPMLTAIKSKQKAGA